MTSPRLALPCLVLLSGAFAAEARADVSPAPESTYVGVSVGFPAPIGGMAGLTLHRRFDPRNFAEVTVGTSFLLSGGHVSYGRVLDEGLFGLVGLDASVFAFGPPFLIPGAHLGLGWEWFGDLTRQSISLTGGFPWLGGLRYTVGF